MAAIAANPRARARHVAQSALSSLLNGSGAGGGGGGDWDEDQRAFTTSVLTLEHPKRFGITPRLWLKAILHMNDAVWRAAGNPLSWFQLAGPSPPVGWDATAAGPPEIRLPPVRLASLRGYTYTVWVSLDTSGSAGDASDAGSASGSGAPEGGEGFEPSGSGLTPPPTPASATTSAPEVAKADTRRPSRFLKAAFKSVFKGASGSGGSASSAGAASGPSPGGDRMGSEGSSGPGGGGGGPGSSSGSGAGNGSGVLPPGTISLLRLESRGEGAGVEVLLVPASPSLVAAYAEGAPGGLSPQHSLWHLVVIPGRGTGSGPTPLPPLDATSLVRVVPGAWHSVVVTQAQPFLKRSRARCFFDGSPVAALDVPFPGQKDLDVCSVGAGLTGVCLCECLRRGGW